MRTIAIAFGLAGLLVVVVPAAAVDRIVDDQLVPCVSGLPIYQTISAAVADAVSGETILVCPGSYTESVFVDKLLTLRAQGLVNLVNPGGDGHGFHVFAGGTTIQGFDISGYAEGCGVRLDAAEGVTVLDNRIHASSWGICSDTSAHFRIRNNVIEDNSFTGIELLLASGGQVVNNVLRNNGISGRRCIDAPLIDHNLLTGNGAGILTNDCDAAISNNTLRGNGAGGIRVEETTNPLVTRNLVQFVGTGVTILSVTGGVVSFNSISFNEVGLDVIQSDALTVTRNNVSRNATIDCRWDGFGSNALSGNNCGTQSPPGAFD